MSTQRPCLNPTPRATPRVVKPRARVQADRGGVAAIADHRQHLLQAKRLAAFDHRAEQRPAEALSVRLRAHVDAVLHSVAVALAWPERGGAGKAHDGAFFGHQIGEAEVADDPDATGHLLRSGWLVLEGAESGQDLLAIDRGHRRHVAGLDIADDHRPAQA